MIIFFYDFNSITLVQLPFDWLAATQTELAKSVYVACAILGGP